MILICTSSKRSPNESLTPTPNALEPPAAGAGLDSGLSHHCNRPLGGNAAVVVSAGDLYEAIVPVELRPGAAERGGVMK